MKTLLAVLVVVVLGVVPAAQAQQAAPPGGGPMGPGMMMGMHQQMQGMMQRIAEHSTYMETVRTRKF